MTRRPPRSTPTYTLFPYPTLFRSNASDLGRYRTLRPETRQFQANAVYARALGDIQATINGSLEYNHSRPLQGLPGISVTLPAGNPYSPFDDDVTLNRYVENAPLEQTNRSITSHAGVTLNGRSEEHTSALQSLMRISYADFCLKKKKLSIREQIHTVDQCIDDRVIQERAAE